MNFDPLSFVIGKHGDSGPVRDVVSYLLGRTAGTAGEIWQTLTNVAVASFTAVSATLRELVIDVTPVQSGSGDPSPTNVRPISGWTGAQVTQTGKNLFDKDNRITVQGYFSASQTTFARGSQFRSWAVPCKPGITYYVRNGANTGRMQMGYTKVLPAVGVQVFGIEWGHTTTGDDAKYVVCYAWNSAVDTATFDEVRNAFEITIGPDTTPYAPYSGTVYPVSWQTEAGTVYGGTLRDNGDGTWTLTVTHGRAQVKDFGWTRAQVSGASFYRFWGYLDGKATGLGNIICEALQTSDVAAVADMVDNSIRGASASTTVSIRADAFSTVEELKDTTAGIGNAAIVYELAAPITISITAGSVQVLIGQNNIFADTGNINTIIFRTH